MVLAMTLAQSVFDNAILRDLVANYIGVSEHDISHDTSLADVRLGSIAVIQLVDELLITFSFEIHSNELFELIVYTLLNRLRRSKSADNEVNSQNHVTRARFISKSSQQENSYLVCL